MDSTGIRVKRQWSVEVREVAEARCCQTRKKKEDLAAANMDSLTAQIGTWEGKVKSRPLSGPGHFKLMSSGPS